MYIYIYIYESPRGRAEEFRRQAEAAAEAASIANHIIHNMYIYIYI